MSGARDIQSTLNCTFETSAPRRDTEPVAHNLPVEIGGLALLRRVTRRRIAAGHRDLA
jgi:hypothetical protein